ncbi:MAG: carbonic anhydrase [Flavobacterium sp.]|nr:MAG: carbonic anhydrase [Flavobacterium sp.]
MDIKKVFDNNKAWIEGRLKADTSYFENLAKGQKPEILYIGCSDSRVTAEELMGVSPGEAFVHRNIANMVPNSDLNVMSVINYAVSHLKVNHVVVCGHYGCGGILAAMQQADLGILNPWLRNIRDVYRIHRKELDAITDDDARYARLVELNVQEQCINVIKTVEVQNAVKERGITVHGWIFDLSTGQLNDLNIDIDKITKDIVEIYRIDSEAI